MVKLHPKEKKEDKEYKVRCKKEEVNISRPTSKVWLGFTDINF